MRNSMKSSLTQLAFYVNLHRAVIGPSATLTGRWRPDVDLRRMLTGLCSMLTKKAKISLCFCPQRIYRRRSSSDCMVYAASSVALLLTHNIRILLSRYVLFHSLSWVATSENVPSTCAPGEASDQPTHSRYLIKICTGQFWDSQWYKISSWRQ